MVFKLTPVKVRVVVALDRNLAESSVTFSLRALQKLYVTQSRQLWKRVVSSRLVSWASKQD